MSNIDDLRTAVRMLQVAYETARNRLAETFPDPMVVTTADGRYILLDALTALVNAQSAVAFAVVDDEA